jgi:hypothetical protein
MCTASIRFQSAIESSSSGAVAKWPAELTTASTAEALMRCTDGGVHRVLVCDVALQTDRVAELGGDRLGAAEVEIEHRHAAALGGEAADDGGGQAGAGARREQHLPGEAAVRCDRLVQLPGS